MRRSPLTVIFLAVFVDLLGYGIVVPLLPFYVGRVADGASLVGALTALYAGTQALCGPLLGALSDRFGRRPLLLTCQAGTALAYLLLSRADSLPLLGAALLLDAATGGNLVIAQAYIADSTPPERRAHALGLVGAAFGLGLLLGPALGGALSLAGLHAPALAAAALGAANVLFGLLALPESLPAERRTLPARALLPWAQLAAARELVSLRSLLATVLLLNLAFAGLQSNFPLFTSARFGWGPAANALFFAFVGVCAVLTQVVLLRLAQPRLGDRRLAGAGLALMLLGLTLTGLAPAPWVLYPAVALIAIGSGLAIPALTSLLSAGTPPDAQGRLMGVSGALISLTMVAGPLLAGLTFDLLGPPAPYLLGALCAAAALLVLSSSTDRRVADAPAGGRL